MSLFLIRHGQTNSNRDKIVQSPDTELSYLGHQQAKHLAKRFANRTLSKILCSDYLRTQQSTTPLIAQQNCDLELSPLLRERNFGDIRGLAYCDIEDDFQHKDYVPSNGESYPQFVERVAKAWRFIAEQCRQPHLDVLVMTHGLVLREIVGRYLNVSAEDVLIAGFENTCVIEVDSVDMKTVKQLCDISHLKSVTSTEGGIV